ncbi:hypothetical protein GGX14DRAFT_407993 [Mycena pura]|uniref:Uncharacterized protein n=1 Tax=Mycena pura TaxID=153505 RepID=A0AAD6UNT5_9AGAR|nr:hypothetical protein GGX14DRAFT_407993 [Mycena pura]
MDLETVERGAVITNAETSTSGKKGHKVAIRNLPGVKEAGTNKKHGRVLWGWNPNRPAKLVPSNLGRLPMGKQHISRQRSMKYACRLITEQLEFASDAVKYLMINAQVVVRLGKKYFDMKKTIYHTYSNSRWDLID